jgi:hypothetical protein
MSNICFENQQCHQRVEEAIGGDEFGFQGGVVIEGHSITCMHETMVALRRSE